MKIIKEVIKVSAIVARRMLFRQNISFLRKRKQVQNDVDNKFHKRWNTDDNRTPMFFLFNGWASTRISFFRSGQHFLLHHSICLEFSHSYCSSQGILPSPALQTDLLVVLVTINTNDSGYFQICFIGNS